MNIKNPLNFNIITQQGSSFSLDCVFNFNNSAVDMTGYTAEMYIGFDNSDTNKTDKSSWVTFSPTYNKFIITVPSSFTLIPDYYKYYYNIILTDTTGNKYNVLNGDLIIKKVLK